MLKKSTIAAIKSGALTKAAGYIVVPMCHYPRGLAKAKIDEYVRALAPDKELLDDFHAEKEKLGDNHNAAFLSCKYQQRFALSEDGIAALKRMAELGRERDVYFVCQCALDQRCHRELLLIAAKRWWNAPTELRAFSYPEFEARLGGEGEIAAMGAA